MATTSPQHKGLRFGVVNETVLDGPAWRDHVRRVEDAGVDVFLVRDHFAAGAFGQQFAPLGSLATAAAITTRLHVGTMVICNDFRHPVLVAHEAASIHHLSGGRFELGLGAGWYEPEYRAAGLAFDPPRQRIGRLEEALAIIKALFSGAEVSHHGDAYRIDALDLGVLPELRAYPRLVVGAGGPRMLRIAARHADVVGLLPAPIRDSDDSDDPADRTPAAVDAKLGVLRDAAGDRFAELELSAFMTVRVTGQRRAATEQLIAERGWSGIEPEDVWEMPMIFIGSAGQIREDLAARRERFGLSYFVTSDRNLPALTEIIGELSR